MKTLDQIKSEIMDDIVGINSNVRFVPGDSQYDVVVGATSPQFYRYEALLDFESRISSLSGFISVIGDDVYKQTLATAFGTKEDGTPYTLADINTLISTRLDAYVADWNMPRQLGSKASTVERVFLSNSSPLDWNIATNFTSQTGVTYNPVGSVPLVSPNFDVNSGKYYVDIPIISANPGVNGNASVGAITSMEPKPANFSSCTNLSVADGGSDQENDLDYIKRAQGAWVGRVNGGLGGLITQAELQSYVDSANTFDEDDVAEGITIGSVCDVETQFSAEDTQLVEDIQYWPGFGDDTVQEFSFIVMNQPTVSNVTPTIFRYLSGTEEQVVPGDYVLSLASGSNTSVTTSKLVDSGASFLTDVVIGSAVVNTSDNLTALVTAVDSDSSLSLDKDIFSATPKNYSVYVNQLNAVSLTADTSAFARSNKASDSVSIKMVLNDATYQRKLRIVYAFDKNPTKLQNVFNDPGTRMIGPIPLVKKAISIPIQITVEPQISFGADVPTVQADITNNLSIFFSGGTTSYGKQYARKGLGEEILHSDIEYVILRTPNVVSFDTDTFRVLNTVTLSLEDPSIILANQYATLYGVVFNFADFNLANFTANSI
jgi:uncharacterized phage protein gp47/JayE